MSFSTFPGSYFYPRSPRGERLKGTSLMRRQMPFLSTLPAWGATQRIMGEYLHILISIHAPRVGSDPPLADGA